MFNKDVLSTVQSHLQSATFVIKAKNQEEPSGEQPHVELNQASFTTSLTPAPNSNHQKQLRFFSTKKKIHHNNKRWAKPTPIKEAKANKKLATTPVKVCSVCWKEDDHETEDEVSWIQCNSCQVWIHISCATAPPENTTDTFICNICQS